MNKTKSQFKKYIEQFTSLSEKEWQQFLSSFILQQLDKDEELFTQGQSCDFIAYILKGGFISYRCSIKGDEQASNFAFEGHWITDFISFIRKEPCTLMIRAIEPAEVLFIKQEDMVELYSKIPKLERLGRLLTEHVVMQLIQQKIDFQTLSASERYLNFVKRYPQVIQRVPQYHIANYLGIAPKSLSRIRTEISMK